jgi:hypothetical protein
MPITCNCNSLNASVTTECFKASIYCVMLRFDSLLSLFSHDNHTENNIYDYACSIDIFTLPVYWFVVACNVVHHAQYLKSSPPPHLDLILCFVKHVIVPSNYRANYGILCQGFHFVQLLMSLATELPESIIPDLRS